MRLHLDGDVVVYRAGFAAEKMQYYLIHGDRARAFNYKAELEAFLASKRLTIDEVEWERRREPEPVENALYNAKSIIDGAINKLQCNADDCTVYLSGPTNFRDGVATLKPYKGNRDDAEKPIHATAIKEFIERRYNTVWSVDEEADDVISYSHMALYIQDPESSTIVTVDKDLDMVPGLHYNFVKEDAYYVDEDTAEWYFQRQLLTGDATDNIPGIKGLGNKRAAALLNNTEDRWELIAQEYCKHYKDDWFRALTEVGQLLWMRRRPNEWWAPPEEITPC